MRSLIRLIRLLDGALACVETAGVTVGLLVMVGLAFAQVILRNVGHGGIPWFPTVTQHLVIWVGMLGASLAARDRKHISIEVISKSVTPQGRRVVEGMVDVATIFLCLIFALVSWKYVELQERPDGKVLFELGGVAFRRWWSFCVIPAGFSAIAFRYFRLSVERIFVEAPVDIRAEKRREFEEYERRHSSDEKVPGGEEAAGEPPEGPGGGP